MRSRAPVNDNGAIVGTATYSGSNTNITTGSHGVMLLPCQFALLNGASSGPDGKDFDGNRPTTLSATSGYNTSTAVANDIGATYDDGPGNYGIDAIGLDLPLGDGRANVTTPVYIPEAHQCYLNSLMMLAKVSPSSATNITYGWNRVYQGGDVAIAHTATNTWYVTKIGLPTGVPIPQQDLDSGVYGYETIVPSANNVLTCWDNPGMYVPNYTNNAPNIGDIAYHKFAFTYSLTNSVGSVSAIATLQVGQRMAIRRMAANNVIASDWTNIVDTVSTTNIPSPYFTTNEIRALVSPSTDRIIFGVNVLVAP